MASSSLSQSNQLANSLSEFSWELYRNLGQDPSANLFFSPYSIMAALAMTFAGSSNNTADQMSQVLRFNNLKDTNIHEAFQKFNDDIFSSKALFTLKSANRLYAQKDYNFLDSFLRITELSYKAGLVPVDFKTDAESARSSINDWVSEQTNNKINNLIAPGVLDSLTVLVLVNAVYFKGNWLSKFHPERTSVKPFKVSGETIAVDMMFKKHPFEYYEDQNLGCQVLSLPYVGNSLSMVIVLPEPSASLSDLESKLNPDVITSWKKGGRKQKVNVHLPRFKLETSFLLNVQLSLMGMTDLFDPKKADLSGIAGTSDLYLSKVIHKAFVEVNEEGTEAAAATAGVMKKRSIEIIPSFTADHPFVFFITDNSTSSILFLGRVVRPPKSQKKEEL